MRLGLVALTFQVDCLAIRSVGDRVSPNGIKWMPSILGIGEQPIDKGANVIQSLSNLGELESDIHTRRFRHMVGHIVPLCHTYGVHRASN